MLLFLTCIVAGLLTPLAPCILPLLPVILGSGSVLGRRALFTITASLSVSVIVFTLLLKASSVFIDVPPVVWTTVSAVIIGMFGLILVFPRIWEAVPIGRLNARAMRRLSAGKGGWRDIVVGAALGPVFTTCSPTYFIVLASVLPFDALSGVTYLVAYTAGLATMLLLIGLIGERLSRRLEGLADPHGPFKRTLGVVFIAVAVIVGFGYDKEIQRALLDAGFYDVTRIEQRLLGAPQHRGTSTEIMIDDAARIAHKEMLFERAPEINAPAGFINSDPITLSQFVGKKVVLLDIWTYSCINCQRTIPYLNAWYEAYEKDGLVIIGIHTPEFSFEKDIDNVRWAVESLGIRYPTVLDNDYETWRALGNNYWPRKYLIDIDGFIVYDHAGEGAYEETEIAIQQALIERAVLLGSARENRATVSGGVEADERQFAHSREIYLGALRNSLLGNGVSGLIGPRAFVMPADLVTGRFYLEGMWTVQDESSTAQAPARLRVRYMGKDVFMVASGDAVLRILLDGEPLSDSAGPDAPEGDANVTEERLYHLVRTDDAGEHVLEIQIIRGTLDAYTFTFG